jgi:hypothetical protein
MEGSDSRGSYRLPNLHMKQPARIDEAQFLSTLCIRVADASHFTHAGHGGGSDYRVGILLAFWPSETVSRRKALRQRVGPSTGASSRVTKNSPITNPALRRDRICAQGPETMTPIKAPAIRLM